MDSSFGRGTTHLIIIHPSKTAKALTRTSRGPLISEGFIEGRKDNQRDFAHRGRASPSIAVDTYDRHLSDMGREGHDKDLAMGRVYSQADEARHVDHKSTNKNIISKASHKPK